MPIRQTYNLAILLAEKQSISEKDQPDGYAGLDANGDIVGPIVLRETTNGDIPIDREIVIKGDSVSVGDGSTIGGIEVDIDDETMKLIKPSDGAIMATRRSSGDFSIVCQTTSGQYAVDWWDGTRTLHNSNVAATKACSDNSLKIVKVYPATTGESLTSIYCPDQTLVSINVSGLTALTALGCGDNLIETLDVLGLTSLTNLDCYNNLLTSLDLSGLTSLNSLNCGGNQLTFLDISEAISLIVLACDNNLITSLRATGVILSYGYTTYGSTIAGNLLDANALDQFYTDLGEDVGATGVIDVTGNPGTGDDDPTIATAKGYTIIGS